MSDYNIYIDESGAFSYRRKLSYVGGYICKRSNDKTIKSKLVKQVEAFNKWLTNNHPGQARLKCPDHLHFYPLHKKKLRVNQDHDIRVSPHLVPRFFRMLFPALRPLIPFVFRSKGLPRVIANDHACYVEVLVHTLIQLLNVTPLRDCSSIGIVVAHRRGLTRYGEEGYKHQAEYEESLVKSILKEISEVFFSDDRQISFTFSSPRTNHMLTVADLFCGAMSSNKYDYLDSTYSKRVFNFSDAYKRISKRLVVQLKYEFENIDPVVALRRLIDALSSDMGNVEYTKLLDSMIERLGDELRSDFINEQTAALKSLDAGTVSAYDKLADYTNICIITRGTIPSDPSEMTPQERRLFAAILLTSIKIVAHNGSDDVTLVNDYEHFFNKFGLITFESHLERMSDTIEFELMAAQIRFFNSLNFEDVEPGMQNLLKSYRRFFYEHSGSAVMKDANIARLEGTIGQMFAIVGDMKKDDFMMDYAEAHFINDIDACHEGSVFWFQGIGYLTVLYWKRELLDKCVDSFIKECKKESNTSEWIFDLNDLSSAKMMQKPFVLLHRLQICALGQKQGMDIKGAQTAKNLLIESGYLGLYPRNQAAKWLAIILVKKGLLEEALELIESTNIDDAYLPNALELVRFPMRVIRSYLQEQLGQTASFSVENYLESLDSVNPNLKRFLSKLRDYHILFDDEDLDAYDIGAMLPFYYS